MKTYLINCGIVLLVLAINLTIYRILGIDPGDDAFECTAIGVLTCWAAQQHDRIRELEGRV